MASALAYRLWAWVILARKPWKLPAETISESYKKEYGTDSIEIHKDALDEKDIVLIHDDLLATWGTLKAVENLVKKFNPQKIYLNTIIEITDEGLHGRDLLEGEFSTLIHC